MIAMELIKQRVKLYTGGYCAVPGVLNEREVEACRLALYEPAGIDRIVAENLERLGLILFSLGFTKAQPYGADDATRPMQSNPLPFAQSWQWWNADISAEVEPVLIGMQTFLRDARRRNAGPVVRVGSHLKPRQRDYELQALEMPAGSVLIFDSRLQRATTPNRTDAPTESFITWFKVREFTPDATAACADPASSWNHRF